MKDFRLKRAASPLKKIGQKADLNAGMFCNQQAQARKQKVKAFHQKVYYLCGQQLIWSYPHKPKFVDLTD